MRSILLMTLIIMFGTTGCAYWEGFRHDRCMEARQPKTKKGSVGEAGPSAPTTPAQAPASGGGSAATMIAPLR